MKIHWTPWFNVPNNRRMELFSVGILMFCAFGLIPTTISIILYILVNECFGEHTFKGTLNVANSIQIHFSMPVISICEPFACFIWHLFTMIDTRATEADVGLGKYRNSVKIGISTVNILHGFTFPMELKISHGN